MRKLKQSTARNIMVLMTDATDHITGLSGLTLTITISKDGGAFNSTSPSVTDRGSGWYEIALATGDTSALGDLALHITGTNADPADLVMEVVAYDAQDSVRMGLTALPNAAAEASGGLYTRGAGAGQIAQDANGRIDVNVKSWLQTAVTLTSSLPDVNTKTIASGIIAAATFAANALDAVWSTTVRTITGGTITTVSDKTGYALSTAGAQAIWDALTSASTTVGSMGKWLLDKLDVVLSTRLATSGYTAPDNASITAIKAKTDNLPADPASVTDVNAARDVVIDTLETNDLVPMQADITAIKAKTDNLPASPAATGDIPAADITAIKAKTDNLPAAPASTGDVTTVGTAVSAIPTTPLLAADYSTSIGDQQGVSISDYLIDLANQISNVSDNTDDTLSNQRQIDIRRSQTFVYQFAMYNSSGAPAAGLTVTAKFSLDGATFATCENSVVEVGSGLYSVLLATTETDGLRIGLQFSATGAITQTATEYILI